MIIANKPVVDRTLTSKLNNAEKVCLSIKSQVQFIMQGKIFTTLLDVSDD